MRTESPTWRKSSHSSNGANCVELRSDLRAIRDSKNPTGPTLPNNTKSLITAIKANHLPG